MRVSNSRYYSMSSFLKFSLLCVLALLCGASPLLAATPAAGELEERLVRGAYAKLVIYYLATEGVTDAGRDRLARLAAGDPEAARRQFSIELLSVRTGPIVDILDRPYGELVTRPSGEVPHVSKGTVVRDGESHLGVIAQWGQGQFATDDWGDRTVRDVLSRDGDRDIHKYTAYEVDVSFDGRSRRYRAMAIYHEPYGSVESATVEYLDNFVGGQVLAAITSDRRPPLPDPSRSDSGNRERLLIGRLDTCEAKTETGGTLTHNPPAGGVGHKACLFCDDGTGGSHGMWASMNGICTTQANCARTCTFGGMGADAWENGWTTRCHVLEVDWAVTPDSADGADRARTLRCAQAFGATVKACDDCRCEGGSLSIGIGFNQFSLKYEVTSMAGTGFWTEKFVANHTCGAASTAPPKKRVRKVCQACGMAPPKVATSASVGTLAFDTICEDVPAGELGYDTCEEAALAEPDPTCDSCSLCNFNGICEFGESASTCPDCVQTGCNSNFSCEPWLGENEWNCVDCMSSCIPCQGMTCGTDWLCGGVSCGNCFPGETCNSSNQCEGSSVCDPCFNAVGAACGWMWSSDCGRMADCGCPAPGETCQNGQCVFSGGGDPGGGDDGLPDRWGCNCWGQDWDCTWDELIRLWDAFCLEQGSQ